MTLKKKELLVISGLVIASPQALADLCSSQAVPGVVTPSYNQNGQLVSVEHHLMRETAQLHFKGDKLSHILQTRFKEQLPKPDKHGRTEFWVPTRTSEYHLGTGKLIEVKTYELSKLSPGKYPAGYETSIKIPPGLDLEALRNPVDKKLVFEGNAEKCDIMYDCKPLGVRKIEITEPTSANSSDACFELGGHKFALRKTAILETSPKVESNQELPKADGEKKICLKDNSGCIIIHDESESEESKDGA